MNPMFEQVGIGTSQSLKVKQYVLPNLDIPYHHHPEIEIVFVISSSGKVFVKNSVLPFQKGDLFMFGSNVPHLFINDKVYYDEELKTKEVKLIVIQFHSELFNDKFLRLPEFKGIEKLIHQSMYGIKYSNIPNSEIHHRALELERARGIDRLVKAISLLELLRADHKFEAIDKFGGNDLELKVNTRMEKINRFLLQNYQRDVSLDEVAGIANMTKSSFCRYFKEHARRTFSEYLNELRIDYACKLLMEGSFSISRISYEVGYNSIPYFIQRFRKIHHISPKEYRMKFSINKHGS